MKRIAVLLVLLTGFELGAQVPAPPAARSTAPAAPAAPAASAATPTPRQPRMGGTNGFTQPLFPAAAPNANPAASMPAASQAAPARPEETMAAGTITWNGVDVKTVLDIYAQYVGRTLLIGNIPNAQITLVTRTVLTKSEVIQAIQAVLALNGIAVVNMGDKFVKVVPVGEANTTGAELSESAVDQIPPLGSYITHVTQLRYVKPSLMIPLIQPFAKLQGGLFAIDDNGILVIRDYAENVKRMLEMIGKIDISVPAEYISEVIPIRYADAVEIAAALNSLGGSGGSTVSFGSSASRSSSVSGLRGGSTGSTLGSGLGSGSAGGMSGGSSLSGLSRSSSTSASGAASTTANGTPSSSTSFQSRLQAIINRSSTGSGSGSSSGQDQIQVFGQAKIIADQRANALLVFATRADLHQIKEVISQLDVLLSQVLIESIIMDVGFGNTRETGVSVAQQPKQFNNSDVSGGGYMYNGQSFSSLLQTLVNSNGVSSTIRATSFGTNLSGGFRYFGSIGDTWDIAVKAAETDNNASIIQRPRIQTSQAKTAVFFVGETVPYVTSTYNNAYNGGYGGSSYSQLSVGVELQVTPFINPDGLVVMEIGQEIDEISGYTTIDGNKVPNTIKRTLQSEIAVRNRDTIILGGFVRADKSKSRSGVPLLMDIPLLGWLFRSADESKNRTELLVMMRPTVLQTPELAAAQTIKEARRLPGISRVAADSAVEERTLIEAERKRELKNAKKGQADGFFNMQTELDDTNTAPDVDFGAAPHGAATKDKPVQPVTGGASEDDAKP